MSKQLTVKIEATIGDDPEAMLEAGRSLRWLVENLKLTGSMEVGYEGRTAVLSLRDGQTIGSPSIDLPLEGLQQLVGKRLDLMMHILDLLLSSLDSLTKRLESGPPQLSRQTLDELLVETAELPEALNTMGETARKVAEILGQPEPPVVH